MSFVSRRLLPLAALAVSCVVLAACGGSSSSSGGGGGVLRVGEGPFTAMGEPNPFTATSVNQFSFVYPFLVTNDSNGDVIPDFAKSWKFSADGKTLTMTTVSGAKWNDGKPLTAADAAWTINTLVKFQSGATANLASYTVSNVGSAEAPDDTTLVLHFATPSGSVLGGLVALPILPEHVWAPHATGDGSGLNSFANKLPIVSSGPFNWTKYQKDSFYSFTRNDGYWGPKPKIKGFGVQIFSDEDGMIAALKSGQIDAIDYMAPNNFSAVKGKAGLVADSSPALSTDYMQINANESKDVKYPELGDIRVREALDLSIDRDQIVSLVYGGQGSPGRTVLADANGAWVDKSLQPLPFDIDKANQLLDDAGYKRGSDGIRVANGHPMSYKVIFPDYLVGPGDREFQIIRTGFKQIGVDITKQALDPDAAKALRAEPDGKYLNFAFGMSNDQPFPDPAGTLGRMTCEARAEQNNNTAYCNPAYDKLQEQELTQVDQKARQQTVHQMEKIIQDAHAQLALAYPNSTYAYSDKWGGFAPGLFGWFGGPNSMQTIEKKG